MQQLSFRQRTWRALPAIAFTLVLALLWKSLIFKDQPMAKEHAHRQLPAFNLTDEKSHQQITNNELLGKAHVVHIWASWCHVCIKENDLLLEFKKKYPVSMVGVIYRDEAAKAKKILAKKGDPFDYLLNDKGGKLGHALDILGTPETYVVDAKGNIRFHKSGAMDQHTINKKLIPVLDQIAHEKP